MKKNILRKNNLFRYLTIFIVILFLLQTLYFFFLKNTNESYSLTRKWKEYYSVEDWNIAQHAILDIDGDGQKDIVTFTHCAFLSSVPEENISKENQCTAPYMSNLVFTEESADKIGQRLEPTNRTFGDWPMRKSYIVKTQNNEWKYYYMNGPQIYVYILGTDNLFHRITPSLLDRIDTATYQISHIGVGFIIFVMSFITKG